MRRRSMRRRPTVRPDESMQDHRPPHDLGTWTIYITIMLALVAAAVLLSASLGMGPGVWVLTLFGAGIICALISLAVLPSLRHR